MLRTRVVLLSLGLGVAANAVADTGSVNNGFGIKSWPSSDHYSLVSSVGNPAMASLLIGHKETYRMSFLPTLQLNTEIGQVDNLEDDLEYLSDILDDPDSAQQSASDVLDRFESVLDLMGDQGYVNSSMSFTIPLLPFYMNSKTLGGTIGVNAEVNAIGGFRVLDDALTFDDFQGSFNTATSLYVKAAIEKSLSVNYSRQAYKHKWGTLYAGAKLKLVDMELSKQVLPLMYIDGDQISDIIVDEYDNNLQSSTGMAIDLGFVWDAPTYRVGLTFNNLNEPEFEYGAVGVNCQQISNSNSRDNCEVAKYFAEQKGEINASEVYVKQTTAVVDAMYKLSNRWFVSAAADLVQYTDGIGNAHQWSHISMAYNGEGWVPSARLGYHTNSIGSQTSSVTFGTTLFKYVNFDLEYGLDSVSVDGSDIPRRLGFGLSVQQSF